MKFNAIVGALALACTFAMSGCAVTTRPATQAEVAQAIATNAEMNKIIETGASEGFLVFQDAAGNTVSHERFRALRQPSDGVSMSTYTLFGRKFYTRVSLLPKAGPSA
jgi:hypothetical protein